MTVRTVRILGLVLLVLLAWVPTADPAAPRVLDAIVQRVADGDTLIAETDNGTRLRIRLLGIDAPEVSHNGTPGQPFGEEARGRLEELVKGRAVRMEAYGRDRYKRVLAVLWRNSQNVNLEMVRAGLAEVYRGARCEVYCRELEQAERGARQARAGLWSQVGPESPSAFRRQMRLRGE